MVYLRLMMAGGRPFLFACYAAFFLGMAFWESRLPRRPLKAPRLLRWPANLSLAFFNAFCLWFLLPGFLLGAADWAESRRFGFFNQVETPLIFSAFLTVLMLDWLLYYQHRMFHALSLFWKIHRLHHSDIELDVSDFSRFHILEIAVSLVLQSLLILCLGAPPAGVFLFGFFLNLSLLFVHADIRLPAPAEKALRLLWVTPDMHRIHHSALPAERGGNFGFIFSFWDRVFQTYRREPRDGPEGMTLGLPLFRRWRDQTPVRLLRQPFLDRSDRFSFANLFRREETP
jgi:sterol desaturase/sphingolipid hydroxylase (fatty acid hydroxylase superfamily)